jgi:hypothetical protein
MLLSPSREDTGICLRTDLRLRVSMECKETPRRIRPRCQNLENVARPTASRSTARAVGIALSRGSTPICRRLGTESKVGPLRHRPRCQRLENMARPMTSRSTASGGYGPVSREYSEKLSDGPPQPRDQGKHGKGDKHGKHGHDVGKPAGAENGHDSGKKKSE